MSHAFHESLPGYQHANIWHDGCPECEERAAALPESLHALDKSRFAQAWSLMLAEKWGPGYGSTQQISDCDHKLITSLYTIAVVLERNAGIDPHTLLR